MQLVSKLALNLLWIAAAAFVLVASAASAQTYPPGTDTLTTDADDTTPEPGSSVNVTGTVLDADGSPVEGADVTFTITSNPGAASFSNGQQSITAKTDANGVAIVALSTGANPGTIVVRVDSGGKVSQVTLTTGEPQALPKTGGAPGISGTSLPFTVGAGAGILILLAAGAVTARRLRVVGS
ncbi:MAG: hypothetical protein WD904_12285 [Dehalococcoidia bacterium]